MRGLAPHDASSSRASAQAPAAHGSVNSKGLAAGKLGLTSPTFIGLGNASIADDVFFALKDATLGSLGWVFACRIGFSAGSLPNHYLAHRARHLCYGCLQDSARAFCAHESDFSCSRTRHLDYGHRREGPRNRRMPGALAVPRPRAPLQKVTTFTS